MSELPATPLPEVEETQRELRGKMEDSNIKVQYMPKSSYYKKTWRRSVLLMLLALLSWPMVFYAQSDSTRVFTSEAPLVYEDVWDLWPYSFLNDNGEPDGFNIDLNDNMKALCNMSDDNPETKRFWETVCMFDIPLFRNIYSPNDHSDLLVCQHMDYPEMGINRFIEFYILPLFNKEGETANYFITTLDVTDDRNRDHLHHLQEREVQAIQEEIGRQKESLAFLLEHSDRHLEQGDGGEISITIDTTKLEEARQQLEAMTKLANESVRLKSGFMASMTHELRTPLNAIVGFTGVLEALADSPERGEYVHIIRNSSDMLQRLINDIIDASQATGGALTIKPEEIDFATAFDYICLTLEQRINGKALQFIKENPYDSFITTLDIGRIQQVLTNFVTNAVKFTNEGHIRLGYRYEKHGLYLYCEDTGIGIPRDKQQVVFDRFVKLDEFVQGTGMGLAICKSIADSCEGDIGVISRGEGKGSTFWFWIPCEEGLQV